MTMTAPSKLSVVAKAKLNKRRKGVVLANQDFTKECVLATETGYIATDAYPHEVSCIRVLDHNGKEIGYWTIDELKEDPVEVLGAFFGCIAGGKKA